MLFGTLQFLIFFSVVMMSVWLCRNNTLRKVLLVAASYVFYSYWDWRFLSLVVFVTVCAYGSARFFERMDAPGARRAVLTVSIALQLAVLGFFKYFHFFADNATALARLAGAHIDAPMLAIILPVGLSFYVFHSICYTVDCYNGKFAPGEYGPVDVALYIAFFPQLIAGPIVRGTDFLPQLQRSPAWSGERTVWAMRLFAIGFCYKYLVADNLALIADPVFASPSGWSGAATWAGVTAYYGQIYFDFAGYSNMAIGCAGLLGYVLPINFNFPYTALSTTDFWRRWHISLSSWLRDYLFIPLGGSRRGRARYYLNLCITMGLGGLWHGASWNFAAWGMLHGAGLTVHKVITKEKPSAVKAPAARVVLSAGALMITQLWVMVLWVFFRSQSFADSALILRKLFTLPNGPGLQTMSLGAVLLPVVLVAVDGAAGRLPDRKPGAAPMPVRAFAYGATKGLAVAATLFGWVMENKPFIYFQF